MAVMGRRRPLTDANHQDQRVHKAAVKACKPPSGRCTSQDTTQMGLTLADRWQTRSLWQLANLRVCMWRDSRSGGCSIARSRAEALAGQTEMSEAKVAMTLAEAIETTRIHRVAGLTGARTAFVTVYPASV
jgi:hypothetical protein